MLYIVTLIVILYLVFQYDFKERVVQRDLYFKILLVWFVLVSGLSYNVGADIPGYMIQYDEFKWSVIHSIGDLSQYRHRQPGWTAINLFCKLFTDNFVLFKLIHAIFVNTVIFRFIKKYCPYVFTGILFYAVFLYLQLNFNALRQAYSLGFFLLGFDYLVKKKFVKYYIFAFLAFMFHTSASICFVFPLLMMFKLSKRNVTITLISILAIVLFSRFFFIELLSGIVADLLADNNQLSVEYGEVGNKFLGDRYVTNTEITFWGFVEIIMRLMFIFLLVTYCKKKSVLHNMFGVFTLVYALFYMLNSFVPVLFFRLLYYVQLFFLVSLSVFCIKGVKQYVPKQRDVVTLIVILFFCYTPIKALFAVNPRSGLTDLAQFYPYSSVFDKSIYPPRAAQWGWHE